MRRKWGAKCHTGPSAQRDERKRFTRSRFGVRPRRCPQSPPPLKIHERPPPPYTASLVRSLLSAWASFREACAKRIRSFSLVLRCPLVLLVSQKSRVLGPPRAGGGEGEDGGGNLEDYCRRYVSVRRGRRCRRRRTLGWLAGVVKGGGLAEGGGTRRRNELLLRRPRVYLASFLTLPALFFLSFRFF